MFEISFYIYTELIYILFDWICLVNLLCIGCYTYIERTSTSPIGWIMRRHFHSQSQRTKTITKQCSCTSSDTETGYRVGCMRMVVQPDSDVAFCFSVRFPRS